MSDAKFLRNTAAYVFGYLLFKNTFYLIFAHIMYY